MKIQKKLGFFDVFLLCLLSVYALIILYPFYNALLVSIVPQNDYVRSPFMLFPKRLDFGSYRYLIASGSLFRGMKVTSMVTVVGVIYNMLLTTICAYCMTKQFPGRKFLGYAIVFTVYFTGGLIPNYLLMKDLHLMDKTASMIIPLGISFMYMTVISKHFDSLPKELDESAKIDGASEFTILFRIILPLSLPILATFTLYYSVDRWNEWWNGMLYIKSSAKLPLQLVLRNIIQDASSNKDAASLAGVDIPFDEGIKMAGTMISTLPIMIAYPFLQKYFVAGLTVGAVKG